MSGKNVIQKILAKAVGKKSVETGEYLIASSNCPTPGQGDTIGRGMEDIQKAGAKLFDPNRVYICVGKGLDGANVGETRARVREWTKAMGVPKKNFVELGRHGVPVIVCGEHAWPRPGEIYFSMTDGATATLGALGCFAITLSSEAGAYLVIGSTWLQVPEVVRFTLSGKAQTGVMARDIYEYILGQIGAAGTTGQVILWDGDYTSGLSMDGRYSLCSNAICSSAWTCIVEPDKTTLDYVKARTKEPLRPVYGDPDAEYAQHRTWDVSKIEPQVVLPPHRDGAVDVTKCEGKRITVCALGSCSNGYLEDMRIAAAILKGRQVHPDVHLNITPGSTEVYLQAIKEGLMQTFVEAGAYIPAPSCGVCGGGNHLVPGDVCIASTTVNLPGRMGSQQAEILLASSATVAASAVEGCVTDPRKFLKNEPKAARPRAKRGG